MQERLQKIISQAGITSRRHAEEFIVSGKVKVNGKLVKELGSKADPGKENGNSLITAERFAVLFQAPLKLKNEQEFLFGGS